jgi:hypothetical protein
MLEDATIDLPGTGRISVTLQHNEDSERHERGFSMREESPQALADAVTLGIALGRAISSLQRRDGASKRNDEHQSLVRFPECRGGNHGAATRREGSAEPRRLRSLPSSIRRPSSPGRDSTCRLRRRHAAEHKRAWSTRTRGTIYGYMPLLERMERAPVNCTCVDDSHCIEHKHGAEKKAQREDLRVIRLVVVG